MKYAVPIVILVAVMMSIAGCASHITPIYQDSSLAVRLEPNPAGAPKETLARNGMLPGPEEFTGTLRGFYVQKKQGLFDYLIGGSKTQAVFPDESLSLLSSELLKGLRTATPEERVAFQIWRSNAKGLRDETDGAMYRRGNLLYVSLDKFRVVERMSYESAEFASGRDFNLFFEPSDAVVDPEKGLATRVLGSDRPEVIVDLNRLSGAHPMVDAAIRSKAESRPVSQEDTLSRGGPRDAQAVTPSSSMDQTMLQKQIAELTATNQQLKKTSAATEEQLNALRQELADVKQALADKVIELDRLKNKSKRKPTVPSP